MLPIFENILDICCQHLEKISNFEGFCLGNEHILLDICCQHLRIYVSWRVSVGPSGPGLGNVLGDEFVLKVACPQRRLSSTSPVLNVVCPQRRLSSMSLSSTSCPQRRLSSMSHRGGGYKLKNVCTIQHS